MSDDNDQEKIPTNPLPDRLPRDIGELYQMLTSRIDSSIETAFAEAERVSRERYVDLRGRIDEMDSRLNSRLEKIERYVSDIDSRLDAHIRDLIHTKDR